MKAKEKRKSERNVDENEEHVKEFEDSSKTMLLAITMVNAALVSREYSMIVWNSTGKIYTCRCLVIL